MSLRLTSEINVGDTVIFSRHWGFSEGSMTVGKKYTVLSKTESDILITDDKGRGNWWQPELFELC